MQRIGFIGASGMMGDGMARNLLAKGYPLVLTVHRNRERVADLSHKPRALRWPRRLQSDRRPVST